jgi:methylenetetrahydrofolate dehydrogenase (NADP+)/methenyltetrahydrofolate cyclohydrolase
MAAQLIDGKALAQTIREEAASRAEALRSQGVRPGLAVILVGADPASEVYVRNKVRACESYGLRSEFIKLDSSVDSDELLSHIVRLNADNEIHGILVQLPLPAHIDAQAVIEAIAPEKDVDGFHVVNSGALMTGAPRFHPCTPYGVLKMLEKYEIPVKGADAVVIGRSNIVGKPMTILLADRGATVTICNSKTRDLGRYTRQADIIVAAAGRRNLLTGDMVKPGATVIDVGINRDEAGHLCGDVDFESVSEVAGHLTPVPGGVGPMTIAMLLLNTVESAERVARSR